MDSGAPYPSGGMLVPNQVMQFQVGTSTTGKDTSVIPPTLAPFTPLNPSTAVNTRILRLVELDDGLGYPLVSLLNYQYWSEPVTETPVINTVEVWNLINETDDASVYMIAAAVLPEVEIGGVTSPLGAIDSPSSLTVDPNRNFAYLLADDWLFYHLWTPGSTLPLFLVRIDLSKPVFGASPTGGIDGKTFWTPSATAIPLP